MLRLEFICLSASVVSPVIHIDCCSVIAHITACTRSLDALKGLELSCDCICCVCVAGSKSFIVLSENDFKIFQFQPTNY